MSRRILWILTIALSLTMAAFVVVQLTWINNAIQLKDEQFRQLINNTLSDVSRQIDSYSANQRMHRIMEDAEEDDLDRRDWTVDVKSIDTPEIVTAKVDNKDIVILPEDETEKKQRIEIVDDTLLVVSVDGMNEVDTLSIFEYDVHFKNDRIKIKEKEILISRVMEQILMEDLSFTEKVDRELLEEVIKKNMLNRGLKIPFEYAVLKNNKIEIYSSEDFSLKTDFYYYRVGLLNEKFSDDENFLYLYFPDQEEVVRGSLSILAPIAIILTFLMIILFIFALYVIFKQKRLSDVKNDFVNNMTHELKTPISTISLASQMLSDDSIPNEQKKIGNISRIIQTESKRLGYQVERVLQMAVLDQGHLVLKKTETDMEEIVSMVMQNFKIQVESRNGKLELNNDLENGLVSGDKVHLMNVVTNLMDNAVKYSKEIPEITVSISNVGKNFALRVKDNGIGIAKEDQKRIFDKFFRVSTGNVHDVKGFGLGLSYVKLIIDQHDGSIQMNSDLGKGTQFDLLIPLCIEK